MKLPATIISLWLCAWAAMGQPTYHGTFIGNGAGLTNLQGLVLPSYALTNFETVDSSFVGFLYGQQTIFGKYLVATQTVTGLGGGYFYGNAFGSGGAPALNCWSDTNTLPVAMFYQGLAGNQNNITMDGLADLVMNGGQILAQGYSNNAGYGTTNNGVGFFGNGAGLTNLTMPGGVLTNGQLGTVMLQGPLYNTNSIFLVDNAGGSIVWSNSAGGLEAFITNDSSHSILTIEGGSLVTIYAGSSGTLTGGDWAVGNPYSFNVPGGDVSAHLGFSSGAGNLAGPTSITVTGSPFTYTATGGVNMIVYISGGIVTAIAINGISIASGLTLTSLTTIPLQAGETVTVAYSSAPTMYYKQL